MKFTLNSVSKCSGRLGILSGLERLPNLALHTPGLIFHTKGGSIPHVSKEVLQHLSPEPQFLQLSISNTIHMEKAVRGCRTTIGEFIAQKDAASMLVHRDPSETPIAGIPERDSVPVYTRCGRRNVTAEEYMGLVETFQPDLYVPLFDGDTDVGCSKKREQKSVDRTERFVARCLEWHRQSDKLRSANIIGPVVGGYNVKLREKAIEWLRQSDADFAGYLIDGLHTNDPATVTQLDSAVLLPVVSSVCHALPEEKIRLCFGAYDPSVILDMVCAGVDVFDTSFAYVKAAQQHRAIVFSFDVATEVEVDKLTTELDTSDAQWAEDFGPLLSGCSCYTCQTHSRAYVHHLYNTREMLGPILLMIHNLHHYMEFFKSIRSHVANDTVAQLKEHLSRQQKLPPYVPKTEQRKPSPAMVEKEPKTIAVDQEQNLIKKQRS